MELVDFRLGWEHDRRPDAGVEQSARAQGDGEQQEAGEGQDAGHGCI
jgi:hypothetical protein